MKNPHLLLAATLLAVCSITLAEEPTLRLSNVPDSLVFPLPAGANQILSATVKGAQARSVWLAEDKGAAARIILTRVEPGEYQINLADPSVAALLATGSRTGQFRIFAETETGAIMESLPVCYAFGDTAGTAQFYAIVDGKMRKLEPPTQSESVRQAVRACGWDIGGSLPGAFWFDEDEVEAFEVHSSWSAPLASVHAMSDTGEWPFVLGANPNAFRLDVSADIAAAWHKTGTMAIQVAVNGAETQRRLVSLRPQALDLPEGSARFVVWQRSCESVPGSRDYLRLCLEDITWGQVLVRLATADGKFLIESTSVRPGDTLPFKVGDSGYFLCADRYVNRLFDNDFGVFSVWKKGLEARNEIERLIERVATSDIGFVREEVTYTGTEAAAHLRKKLQWSGPDVITANDFIDKVASRSLLTGNPYLVKLPNGKTVKAKAWLRKMAADLATEEKAKDAPASHPESKEHAD